MNSFVSLSGTVVSALGALAIYVGCRHQALLAQRMPPRWIWPVGAALCGTAWALWSLVVHPATALCIVLMLLMIVWSIAPILIAFATRQQKDPS